MQPPLSLLSRISAMSLSSKVWAGYGPAGPVMDIHHLIYNSFNYISVNSWVTSIRNLVNKFYLFSKNRTNLLPNRKPEFFFNKPTFGFGEFGYKPQA